MAVRRRSRTQRCVERVVVPSPEIAYYNYPETGNIESAGLIPLDEILLLSRNISTVDNYTVRLNNGVYRVEFSTAGTPSSTESAGAGIYINGVFTNIVSLSTATANNRYPFSATGVIVSSSEDTLLTLRNFGNTPTSYIFTNLVIERIA